jgi:hypothetical protein
MMVFLMVNNPNYQKGGEASMKEKKLKLYQNNLWKKF